MASSWEQLGELGTVGQLMGLDAVRLIKMIVQAANTARMHKKNCRQFAQHLKLIGNLLEQLKISELKNYPETREPLEQLEDALRKSYVLVNSCQDRSYLYLLAMGWNIVYQFRKAQTEIDRYLRIVPLITLVDNLRVRERLEYIERDQCEYALDEEDKQVQDVILSRDPSQNDMWVLKKSLSCSYPNLPLDTVLQKESEKLQLELQRSQANMDVGQCEVIEHLLGVTETVASSFPEKDYELKNTMNVEEQYSNYEFSKEHNVDQRCISSVSSDHDLISTKGSHQHEEWHSDLLGCCSEPYLCIKTFFYPCGTFSKIASATKNRHVSSTDVCNDLMAYSLILSCCCYTCCVRRKLRQMLNITGGLIDDFLSHLMCCCCALVQEWREVEVRGIYGFLTPLLFARRLQQQLGGPTMSSSEGKKVTLRSSDGQEFEVGEKVAVWSRTIRHVIEGGCTDGAIPLQNVTGAILAKVISYCEKHEEADARYAVFVQCLFGDGGTGQRDRVIDEVLNAWDADFVKVDLATLFGLLQAANYLDIKGLFDLTCQTVANMMKGKSAEELRALFLIENDYTPEEEEEVRRENQWAFQ